LPLLIRDIELDSEPGDELDEELDDEPGDELDGELGVASDDELGVLVAGVGDVR
jgi:hypothetical protein